MFSTPVLDASFLSFRQIALRSSLERKVCQCRCFPRLFPTLSLPPPISSSERLLSRSQRAALSQLRSGHFGRATSSLCPECRFLRHTVTHLFSCPAVPTDITVVDLWVQPVEAMDFLLSLPSFSSLLSPDPPLPPPPPDPPPPPQPPLPPPPPEPPPSPPPSSPSSSFSSISSCSSLRALYSPGPSPCSSSPSTSPKRLFEFGYED